MHGGCVTSRCSWLSELFQTFLGKENCAPLFNCVGKIENFKQIKKEELCRAKGLLEFKNRKWPRGREKGGAGQMAQATTWKLTSSI